LGQSGLPGPASASASAKLIANTAKNIAAKNAVVIDSAFIVLAPSFIL
jgi:hypothetical protein